MKSNLSIMTLAIRENIKLKIKLQNFSYPSDFLLEAIESCEQDNYRLPGALLLDYTYLINTEIVKNAKIKIAIDIYSAFRNSNNTENLSQQEYRDYCLLAACFAYTYCLQEKL